MAWSQRPLVILLASLVLPPAGLVLLWLRRATSLPRKLLGTVAIAILAVAHLFLFYGLRIELLGGMRPSLTFDGGERHYRRLEASRAAAPAPVVSTGAPPPAASNPTARLTGSTYWTDFFGPARQGRYDQQPILTEWPRTGLARLWKQPVGGGYASFTVAHGLAFTIEQRRANEVVAAYDLHTGRELWTNSWPALFHETLGGDGPRATPVWDDGRVYALGAEGELRALDAATGRTVWNKNILEDNAATNLPWGMAASPLIVDDKLIVTPGGPSGRSVVAYHKLTGARLWSALDDQAAYASPAIAELAGRRQLLIVTASRALGLAPEDGKLLWEYPWVTQQGINAAQPLVIPPNRVYLSAAYGHGAALLEITPDSARELWTTNRMKNKFNSAVFHDGHIYGLDEGILACIDAATGSLKWKGGRYGYGQTLLASGHLIVLTEDGDLVLVRATPAAHEEKSRFSALSGKTWNVPAISDGVLLVRNETEMAAFRIAMGR